MLYWLLYSSKFENPGSMSWEATIWVFYALLPGSAVHSLGSPWLILWAIVVNASMQVCMHVLTVFFLSLCVFPHHMYSIRMVRLFSLLVTAKQCTMSLNYF